MENNKILVTLLTAVIITSGCAGMDDILGESEEDTQPEQLPGQGLEVNSFQMSDETLSPGQTAQLTLELQNYHREEIELNEINLYNTGPNLEVDKQGCTPSEEDLEPATEQTNPIIECSWNVQALEEDELGFSQVSESFSANIEYETGIQNLEALEIEFMPLDDIDNTNERSISFTNGEVEVDVITESPVAFGEEQSIEYNIRNAGDGSLGDDIEFDYEPVELFDLTGNDEVTGEDGECPTEEVIVLGSSLEFECDISLDGSTSETRNLFFTADYKYVKSPTMGITIVS